MVAAGLVGFAGNELVAGYRSRAGTEIDSSALVADGLHARTDGFISLAVVIGAIGVMAGFPLVDPIVGLLITVAILAVQAYERKHQLGRTELVRTGWAPEPLAPLRPPWRPC